MNPSKKDAFVIGRIETLVQKIAQLEKRLGQYESRCPNHNEFVEELIAVKGQMYLLQLSVNAEAETFRRAVDTLQRDIVLLKRQVDSVRSNPAPTGNVPRIAFNGTRGAVDNDLLLTRFIATTFLGKDVQVVATSLKDLMAWSNAQSATVVYDSQREQFSEHRLFESVVGLPNVAVIGFTDKHDIFGGFYRQPIAKPNQQNNDPDMFVFALNANGRCKAPKRFVPRKDVKNKANVFFCTHNADGWFVWVGVDGCGFFTLGNPRSKTWGQSLSKAFEGMEDETLTGMKTDADYTCVRLMAMQLS